MVTTDFGTTSDLATCVAIQVVGGQTKIVVGGYTGNGSERDFALARYNATDGSLDTAFDGDGKVTTDFVTGGPDDDRLYGIAIQAEGKVVAVGSAYFGPDLGYDLALARYDAI